MSTEKINAKKPIKILLYIYASLAAVVLIILLALLFSGNLYKRHASILIPDEGNYAESWSEQLPRIAQKLDIPELGIYTYKNFDELQHYLSQSEKYNILWAEIPVCGEYNLEKLLQKVDVCTIDSKYSQLFPWTLHHEIQLITGQKEVKFLPLSYNPYLMVKKAENKNSALFKYSVGAYSKEDAYAFLSYIIAKNSPVNASSKKERVRLSTDEALKIIQKMIASKELLRNAHTYTNRDAFIAMENNTVAECYVSTSFFNTLSISQRQELTFENMETTLICDATIAVFPVRKSEESKKRINNAIQILISPDVIYATANARNWMPASINSVSRSSYTEAIRKQARITSECYIPSMQYSSSAEGEALLRSINDTMQNLTH